MNKLNINSLYTALEKGRSIQKKREEYFSDLSEDWQESEKGVAFEKRTLEFEVALMRLDFAIGKLDNWNNGI